MTLESIFGNLSALDWKGWTWVTVMYAIAMWQGWDFRKKYLEQRK